MMEKLVGKQVTITGDDVKKGFEARFGPKVKCRMIVVQEGNTALAEQVWRDARKSPKDFIEKAESQFIPNLAQKKGEVPPIHKHFGDKQIEDTAFRMKVGDVSEPLKMPDGTFVILLCEEHIAADLTTKYDHVWMQIHKEVQDLKVAQKIPEVFNELRTKANVRMVLDNAVSHLARNEHMRGGLSAFDQMPQGPPPAPTNVPAPQPGKVLAPDGVVPTLPNVAPSPPLNIVPNLPKIELQSPTEKK
jgi:PPIC-type PPIASE domain